MSDEMKSISEDAGAAAAGNASRRSSAEAAALTVGSPSSSSEQPRNSAPAAHRVPLSVATRAGIAVLAVVSALFIGVSAFALTDGFGLPADSPIMKAAQSVGIVHVRETVESSHASGTSANTGDVRHAAHADVADEADEAEGESNADETAADANSYDDASAAGDSSSDGDSTTDASSSSDAAISSSAGSNSGSGSAASSGQSSSNGASNPSGSSGSSNFGATSGGSSQSSSSSSSNAITVYVSVSSSAVGNPVSGGGTFTFNRGATVYDALCACGLSMNASNTGYGVYVAAIGGLAEKEHGANSGWMYSVNGTVPMTACSNYKLQDGDSVSWYYVTG